MTDGHTDNGACALLTCDCLCKVISCLYPHRDQARIEALDAWNLQHRVDTAMKALHLPPPDAGEYGDTHSA